MIAEGCEEYGEQSCDCRVSCKRLKQLKKFLGSTYEVDASNGHVRDLPKSQLGIDVEMIMNEIYYDPGQGRYPCEASEGSKKKQIKFISQLTLTVREKRFPGI